MHVSATCRFSVSIANTVFYFVGQNFQGVFSDSNNLFFVSPELSSVRDYVITHSVCSMCMYVVFCKIDHCIHRVGQILPFFLKMIKPQVFLWPNLM